MDATKYIGRWKERLVLKFRVWPVGEEARRLTWERTEIPVHGFLVNKWGRLEAAYRFWMDPDSPDKKSGYRTFELSPEDIDILAAVPLLDAKITIKNLKIRAPGTSEGRERQISWMKVPIVVNRSKPMRVKMESHWYYSDAVPPVRRLVGPDLDALLTEQGLEPAKRLFIATTEEVDENVIFKAVTEEDAVIVFGEGVPGDVTRRIVARARWWVVEGRKPDEPGGLLCGYQFCDRFFRWVRRGVGPGLNVHAHDRNHLEKMHEITREKGRRTRRTYFVENVVNGFAKHVGMPRQRLMARFLDDGIVDWLLRSVDAIPSIPGRDAPALLRARVNDAIRALEFLYRAKDPPLIAPNPEEPRKKKGRPFTAPRVDLPSEMGQGVKA